MVAAADRLGDVVDFVLFRLDPVAGTGDQLSADQREAVLVSVVRSLQHHLRTYDVIGRYDGEHLGVLLAALVPMEWGYFGFLFGSRLGERWLSVVESLLGAVSVSGLLWMVGSLFEKIRHKEGLGFGDVKMIAMVGSFLGLAGAFQTIILGSIVGTVIGLMFIKLKRHDSATYELPFGTFLGAAALFVALAQSRVLEFYFR